MKDPTQACLNAPTKLDIQQRLTILTRDDNDLRRAALRAISAQTLPAFKALEEECGTTGHKWRFDHRNFTGEYVWDKCEWCGALEGADKHSRDAKNV